MNVEFENHYHCPCRDGEGFPAAWMDIKNSPNSPDNCFVCGKESLPIKSQQVPFYTLESDYAGENFIFKVFADPKNPDEGGYITSNLVDDYDKAHGNTNEFPDNFLTAVNVLESMILACACAGCAVDSREFKNAIATVLDKIGNEYGD